MEVGVVVLTALEVEYGAVRALLAGHLRVVDVSGTRFEVGSLPGSSTTAAIAVVGAGTVPTAVVAERAIASFRPRVILFAGVAGALKDELQLGDVVVATKIYQYQSGKVDDAGFLARPIAWPAPYDLEQIARHVAREGSWRSLLVDPDLNPSVLFSPIATGDVVLNSRESTLADQLHQHYNDAAAIEMEGSGLANAAHFSHGMRAMTVRGISDKADGTKRPADDANWQPRAARHAAAFTVALALQAIDAQSISATDHAEVSAHEMKTLHDAVSPSVQTVQIGNTVGGDLAGGGIIKK